ncbi:MAG: methyltransferase domain-containing protein [Planctomycetota bacterium]
MIQPRGSVYTPRPLAEELAAAALSAWPHERAPRVCDPACGDGALLAAVAALRPDAQLHGMDCDPDALRRAQARLGARADLRCGDALRDAWPEAPFDFVVANPPWVSFSGRHAHPLPDAEREELRTRYPLFRRWPSLHAAFVQLAVRLARTRIALLLPAQVCDLERYGAVRSHLRAHGRVFEPARLLGEDVFEGVCQPTCLLVVECTPGEADARPIPLRAPDLLPPALDALPRPPAPLFADIGVHTGNCARRLIGEQGRPIREGRDVHPYRLDAPRRRFRDDYVRTGGEYFRAAPEAVYVDVPILLRQTADRPIAALHAKPAYFRNSVLACRGLPDVDPALIVAWLNNPLVARYHQARVREAGQRSFPQVKLRHLRDLPMPDLRRVPDSIRALLGRPSEFDPAFSAWMTTAG